MSEESAVMLKQAATVANVRTKRGLQQKATRFLRKRERDELQSELDRITQVLDPINVRINKMGETQIGDAVRAKRMIEAKLDDESPPTDLSGETKDALYQRQKQLEAEISAVLQPQEVMRRNPVGAVDAFFKGENSPAMKAKILEWKNLKLLLNPDSDERDLCNVEQLRKSAFRPDGAPTYMTESQIPGVFAMTPQAKANWPESMPEYGTANHPFAQAEARERIELEAAQKEIAELKAKLAKTEEAQNERRRAMAEHRSAKKEQQRARMKEYWAKKKGQVAPPNPEQE